MKDYKVLLFDVDNTLLDFDACEKIALSKTFADHHIDFSDAMRNRYLDINGELWKRYEKGLISREEVIYTRFQTLFQEFGIAEDGIAFEHAYRKQLSSAHPLMPHALEVVDALAKRYVLYIVTNGFKVTQDRRLKESGLYPYFKKIFISEEIGYRKPDEKYFEYCFEHIEEACKDEMLLIGDSLSSDMLGGYQVGIDTCWMNPKQEGAPTYPITYEIQSLLELLSLFDNK